MTAALAKGRVFVTGAAGFLGTPTVRALLDRGVAVHAASRRPRSSDDGVHWHVVDLLSRDARSQLESAFEVAKPTHLLHLAWASGRDGFRDGPENYRWIGATVELLERFRAAGGRRAVAVGTGAEYDATSPVCDEATTPLRPGSTYGVCKKLMSELFARYVDQHGLSGAWGRLFYLYGPREDEYRLLPSIVTALMRGESAQCTFDRLERDYLHIDDAARGLVDLLESEVEGPMNIAAGAAISLGELVGRAADQLGLRDRLQLGGEPRGEHPAPTIRANVDRARVELGWTPRLELDAGLAQTLDWWREHLGQEAVDV
ncbi:MAG: NAD(P)-dependent oxidoreductase [Acidobacteriota bacterium]